MTPEEAQATILRQRLLIANQRVQIEQLKAYVRMLSEGTPADPGEARGLLSNFAEDDTIALVEEMEAVKEANPRIKKFLRALKK